MKKILKIFIAIILFGCSEKDYLVNDDGSQISYHLFDNSYTLSQNWYSPTDLFDETECIKNNWCSKSIRDIEIKDNEFSFIDFYGEKRTCSIFQNLSYWPSKAKDKIVTKCVGGSHDELYHLKILDTGILIQEYSSYSGNPYKLFLKPKVIDEKTNKFSSILGLKKSEGVLLDKMNQFATENLIEEITERSDRQAYFIIQHDQELNDGSDGEMIGQILGQGICSYLGLIMDCASGGGEFGKSLTMNDGSIINQSLCIGYIRANSVRTIDRVSYLCELFEHSKESDFIDFIPKVLADPYMYEILLSDTTNS